MAMKNLMVTINLSFTRSRFQGIFPLQVNSGVLDADYEGPVHCCLINLSNDEYRVKRGDILCQVVCEHYEDVFCQEAFGVTGRGDDCDIKRAVISQIVADGPATIPGTPRPISGAQASGPPPTF